MGEPTMTQDQYTDELDTLSFKLPADDAEYIRDLADDLDMSTSELLRRLVDNGLRARKYYEEFEIEQ